MPVEMAFDDPQIATVGSEKEIRNCADQRDRPEHEIDADISSHAGDLPIGHAKIARLPHHPRPQQRSSERADPWNQIEQDIKPDLPVGTGQNEHSLQQFFHRLDPDTDRTGIPGQVCGGTFENSRVNRHYWQMGRRTRFCNIANGLPAERLPVVRS